MMAFPTLEDQIKHKQIHADALAARLDESSSEDDKAELRQADLDLRDLQSRLRSNQAVAVMRKKMSGKPDPVSANAYDARQMSEENRSYQALASIFMASIHYLGRLGWPKDGRGRMMQVASLCYPGMPGPVSGAEMWESGGGTVHAPVRAHVHDPRVIAAVRDRATPAARPPALYLGRVVLSTDGAEVGRIVKIGIGEPCAIVRWPDGTTTNIMARYLVSVGSGRLRIV